MYKGVTDPETGVDIGSLMRSGLSLGDYQQLISDRQAGYTDMDDDWQWENERPVTVGFDGPWASQPTQGEY